MASDPWMIVMDGWRACGWPEDFQFKTRPEAKKKLKLMRQQIPDADLSLVRTSYLQSHSLDELMAKAKTRKQKQSKERFPVTSAISRVVTVGSERNDDEDAKWTMQFIPRFNQLEITAPCGDVTSASIAEMRAVAHAILDNFPDDEGV
jgi:hypothetical protein